VERAFIASKESEYCKDLYAYFELQKQQKKFINKYFEEKGIKAKAYLISGNGSVNSPFKDWQKDDIHISIEAEQSDISKFGKMLCKGNEYGLRRFKVKSEIGKDFAQRCIDEQVIINLYEPKLRDYFSSLGYMGYGLHRFIHNGKLYLKINSDLMSPFEIPKDFTEIKLSEFHKAYEELEKNNKEEK